MLLVSITVPGYIMLGNTLPAEWDIVLNRLDVIKDYWLKHILNGILFFINFSTINYNDNEFE